MKQKAFNFINKKKSYNNYKKIKKISELSQKSTPLKKDTNSINLSSSICQNNIYNKNNKEKKRNASVCNNFTNNKTIKEIKIKSNKKLSQILSLNNKSINNGEKINTISNLSNIERNSDINRYKQFLDSSKIGIGIYFKKKMNTTFKNLSMEKNYGYENTIKSIEIDFGKKKNGNNYTDKERLNPFKVDKIIMIQRYFRKFLEIKHKNRNQDKKLNGIKHLIKYIFYKLSGSVKIFFSVYKLNTNKTKKKIFVKKEEYELLKTLKEKNIDGMINLKKYIVKILNNNRLELF